MHAFENDEIQVKKANKKKNYFKIIYIILPYRPEIIPGKVNNLFCALCLVGDKLSKSFLKQNCDSCYDTQSFICSREREQIL